MTQAAAEAALAAWDMAGAVLSLVAQRENTVFRICHNGAHYALRLHRPGYQDADKVASELAWMQHLRASGLKVPVPQPSNSGAVLREICGYHANVLSWLDGRPVGTTGTPLALRDRCGTFHRMGALQARVHAVSDTWTIPAGFVRPHWDIDGLLGEAPLWDRFWDNPGLRETDRRRVMDARDRLRGELSSVDLDHGLIHADMVRENVMIQGDGLSLIDFDDSGFGFRLFDAATSLFKNRDEPDYDALEAAFLRGYRTVRPLDTTMLAHFTLIRALTYLGWIITRRTEPGAEQRQTRFLATAKPLVDAYLAA